jgi:hypothetical protein
MADQKEKLKKQIEELKGKLAKSDGAKKEGEARTLRKSIKRAQRKLRLLTPLTIEEKSARTEQLTELVAKQMEQVGQNSKRIEGNPYLKSLRKKTKALNKLKKRLDRFAKKAAAKAAAKAPPAEEKAAEAAPAAEGDKKE